MTWVSFFAKVSLLLLDIFRYYGNLLHSKMQFRDFIPSGPFGC